MVLLTLRWFETVLDDYRGTAPYPGIVLWSAATFKADRLDVIPDTLHGCTAVPHDVSLSRQPWKKATVGISRIVSNMDQYRPLLRYLAVIELENILKGFTDVPAKLVGSLGYPLPQTWLQRIGARSFKHIAFDVSAFDCVLPDRGLLRLPFALQPNKQDKSLLVVL